MFTSLRNGQYQFLDKLGSGGMGEVYQARDTRLNRLVAIKVLKADLTQRPDSQRRFLQEAQSASGLNHPNIIVIYDIFTEQDVDLMVMEYVAGKTLNELIPKGGLRTSQALGYAVQIADALAAAHAAGIVHRDLKPGNIMVTGSGLVKILDFGLAKLVAPETGEDPEATLASSGLTREGAVVGTAAYMSPEQAQGKRVDTRSDIFAFGAVLYEIATGRRAFDGPDAVSILTMILRDEAPAMNEVAPDIPPELNAVVQKCLRKNPDERYQSMKDVWQDLIALKQGSDTGTLYRSRSSLSDAVNPPSKIAEAAPATPPPPAPPARKSPLPLIGGLAALLAAGGGGAWWFLGHRPQPAPAVSETTVAPPPPLPPADKVLTNSDVIDMVKEKVPLTLIINTIRASKSDFKLGAQDVIQLVKQGVPEMVVDVMRDPTKPPPTVAVIAPQAGKAPGGAPQQAPTKNASPAETAAPAPSANSTAAPASPAKPATATLLVIKDGTPLALTLSDSVPEDASEGMPLHFTVEHAIVIDGVTVIAKGAAATGEIYEAGKKRKLLGSKKMTYRMSFVQAIDGKQLRLRATPSAPKADDVSRRPVMPKGSVIPAYIDGDLAVSARQ